LERLCEAVVLCDTSDLQALAGLHAHFEEIARWAVEAGETEVSSAAAGSAELIEKIILSEVEDAAGAFQVIGRAVSAIQSVVRDGRAAAEVDFPEELAAMRDGESVSAGDTAVCDDEAATGEEVASGEKAVADEGAREEGTPEADTREPSIAADASNFTLPSNVDKAILEEFLGRQGTALDEMEALILALEKPGNAESLAELRRRFHTLKGEAAVLGLDDVARLCHGTEDFLSKVAPDRAVDGLLAVKDYLERAFRAYAGKDAQPEPIGNVTDGSVGAASLGGSDASIAQEDAQENRAASAMDGQGDGSSSPVDARGDEGTCDEAGPASLDGDKDLLADFVSEANDHLDAADVHLLTLETDCSDEDALNAVFRAFHTIKGVAGFLALDDIQALAHQAESLLDRARKGEMLLSGQAIDVTFNAVDTMKRLVGYVQESLSSGKPLRKDPSLEELLGRIKAVLAGEALPEESSAGPNENVPPGAKLGDILLKTGAATRESIEKALEKQQEPPSPEKLGQILIDAAVASRKEIDAALEQQRNDPNGPKLGAILVKNGVTTHEEIEAALKKQSRPPSRKKLGEILVREKEASASDVVRALRMQKSAAERRESLHVRETIKIDADRLDRLVDGIGELVIAESMLSQSVESADIHSAQISRQLSQLGKITRELQEIATSLRMVPVRATFQKMARIARDAAKKLGKTINFTMSGENTEIDKTVVDKIGDPLVHMVRNAVDHGIEDDPEKRRAAGKPDAGHVELRAFQKGGSIYIEIEDDGAGLDREKILEKARQRGMAVDGDSMTDREVFNLLFQPGFSTAEKVTDMSGRGVGLDVVKRNIEALRGQVEIQSQLGKGSIFSMRLPLTLAIIDGMIVQIGSERYVIPIPSIITTVHPERNEVSTLLNQGEMLRHEGGVIPIVRLHKVLGVQGAQEDVTKGLVVVVEDDDKRTGLLVDQLIGQQQIVIKSLGGMMRNIPGVSGGAIMPDGKVGLILDVGGLRRLACASDKVEALT